MKKLPVFLLLTSMLLWLCSGVAGAAAADSIADGLDTQDLQGYLNSLDPYLREQLPEFTLDGLSSDTTSNFTPEGIVGRFWRYLAKEIIGNVRLLGQLVLLAVFCALLRVISTAFTVQGAADAAFLVVFFSLLLLSLQAFRTSLDVAVGAIDNMVGFMQAMLPLMTTMLAAVGGITTATVFHPLLVVVVNGVAMMVKNLVLPLVFLAAVLGVLGVIAKDFPMKRLSGLARQWSITVLGLLFVVFFGVMSVRGAIAPVSDGLALKTAKFLTGTFVPVVGSRMAEALDVVVGSSMLLKNAIGAFGLVAVFIITAFPVLKVLAVLVIYRLATALIEPISDERLVDAMSALGNSLTLLLACMLTVGLMFFLCITTLVGLGNIPAYMR